MSIGIRKEVDKMTIYEIKIEMMKANIKQYEVAEKLGYSETVFSKKLRKGLSKEELEKVLMIIKEAKGSVKNG